MIFDVENLIFVYMLICGALILFNLVCIFYFSLRERLVKTKSDSLMTYEEKKICVRKLRRENNLVALEMALDNLKDGNPEEHEKYVSRVKWVFRKIIGRGKARDSLIRAYIYYLSSKFGLFENSTDRRILNPVLRDACTNDIYLKINALRMLFSVGNVGIMSEAIEAIDRKNVSLNNKLLHDGLMTFSGDREALSERLWHIFPQLSFRMQAVLLDYFRFSSGSYQERMLEIMKDPKTDKELVFSCMRYFQKYPYEQALPYLLEFAKGLDDGVWEYSAIAANALTSYPGKESFDALCALLSSKNFRVRYNAAQSLILQGYTEDDLRPILDGDDMYAREALEYRFLQRSQSWKEVKI